MHTFITIFFPLFFVGCLIVLLYQHEVREFVRIKEERLVGIVRVPFEVVTTWGTAEIQYASRYADVYCYENDIGKRQLNINPYNYSGKHSRITNTEIYAKLKDWKSG